MQASVTLSCDGKKDRKQNRKKVSRNIRREKDNVKYKRTDALSLWHQQ